MRDLIKLSFDSGVDMGVSMAMDITPKAAYTIDEFLSVNSGEDTALCVIDQKGFVFRHLREGVPHNLSIPADEVSKVNRQGHKDFRRTLARLWAELPSNRDRVIDAKAEHRLGTFTNDHQMKETIIG